MQEVTLSPGMLVRHPDHPEWGLGQVQSAIGHRISVNFEHRGKQVINAQVIALLPVFEERSRHPTSHG